MPNSNSQPTHVPATSDASPFPTQPTIIVPQTIEGQHTMLTAATQPTGQMSTAASSAAQLNTPLAGSLNSKPPLSYIRASAAQLKSIIQSAPEDARSRIRSNASKEAMLDEVFWLRQQEALDANDTPQQPIDPDHALNKLLTMEPRDVPTAVDTSPDNVRKLMEAALQADNSLNPRVFPEDRHNIIYTVLTWQVNAHKNVNPPGHTAGNRQPTQEVLTQHQQPARLGTTANHGVDNNDAPANPPRQAPNPTEQPSTTLPDILALASPAAPQRGAPQARDPHGIDESDKEVELRRKSVRDGNTMETWIEGFHTGADAALEQTLFSYPENRPGGNRLNVNNFRGPQILGKVINRNMGPAARGHFPVLEEIRQRQAQPVPYGGPQHSKDAAIGDPRAQLSPRGTATSPFARGRSPTPLRNYVRRETNSNRGNARFAWQNIEFLLKSTPSDISTCDDIEEEMTRRLTQSKRRIAATKIMSEADPRRVKRGTNTKGEHASQEGSKRRNHDDDNDNRKEYPQAVRYRQRTQTPSPSLTYNSQA